MKKLALFVLFLSATAAFAEMPAARVLDDAKAIDRVAEMAQGDLPQGVLTRIAERDIELLRGRRPDDSYEYARYERLEESRVSESFSIQPTDPDHLSRVELKGPFVYRVILEVPSRRLVLAKNRSLWIDHVEIEYLPQNGKVSKTQTVKVGLMLEPGNARSVDVEDIARQATVRVFARADKASGYGNLDVTLVKAKIFDNTDSPYADAVASAKAVLRAVEHRDIASTRSNAQRMVSSISSAVPAATVPASAPAVSAAAPPSASEWEITPQLQSIEDLLTGSEAERRDGLDRLHQLIRRLRTP
jgi:hypothetical protein